MSLKKAAQVLTENRQLNKAHDMSNKNAIAIIYAVSMGVAFGGVVYCLAYTECEWICISSKLL